jgi:Uma2 family endonuclease
VGRGGQAHEIVKANFLIELGAYFKQSRIGRVFGETSYQLDEHNAPMPDASVVIGGRLPSGHTGLITVSPDIAIEVVSSESAAQLHAKIALFFQHGTRVILVAYPNHRTISVHTPGRSVELSGDQHLELPDLLPGFSVAVRAFFEGL